MQQDRLLKYFNSESFIEQGNPSRYPKASKVFTVLPHVGKMDAGLLIIGIETLVSDIKNIDITARSTVSMAKRTEQIQNDLLEGPSNPFTKGVIHLAESFLQRPLTQGNKETFIDQFSASNWYLNGCFKDSKAKHFKNMNHDGANNFRNIVEIIQPKVIVLLGKTIYFRHWMKQTSLNSDETIEQTPDTIFYDEFNVKLKDKVWSGNVYRLPHPTGRGSGLPWYETHHSAFKEYVHPFVEKTRHLLSH